MNHEKASFAEIAESINYLYVINESKQLVGVLSYRDLILGEPEEKVQDLMFTRVISADALQDQEEVARLIERYDFLAIPVVEENNVLVGIVTVDDIIDVVIREADEDYEKFAASGKDITFDTKASLIQKSYQKHLLRRFAHRSQDRPLYE